MLVIDISWVAEKKVFKFYQSKLHEIWPSRLKFINPNFKTLDTTFKSALEAPFTIEESGVGMWERKELGSNGFTFSFIKKILESSTRRCYTVSQIL